MQKTSRTNYCGELRESDAGKTVTVCGWVQRRRDLGSLIFATIRDRTGLVQCIFEETQNKELFDRAGALRSEYTVAITGVVRSRGEDAAKAMATGAIEILAHELVIFSRAETPPFEIVENSTVNDVTRLKYRYLDLRRPDLQRVIMLRHKIAMETRSFFASKGFLEIETPMLTKSTPEGARDYLVPSRLHSGKFYALPQSPQQYKQLLMLAGFDRYMQITRCMRDEDLRADRQPEFTQVDLEMSFVDHEDVIAVNEEYMKTLFMNVLGIELKTPFPRLTFKQAMERYGSDKPDIRFGMELCDLGDIAKSCGFKVFSGAMEAGGAVRAIKVEGGAEKFTRKEIDALGEFVKTYRAKGLAWYRNTAEPTSSFAKFLEETEVKAILERMETKTGDLILIVADTDDETCCTALGALRVECARRLLLCDPADYRFLWVVDFPLFEYSEEEDRLVARHHPFTAPMDEDVDMLESKPREVRAKAYDMILNGYELGGGSIRIHSGELQTRMFQSLGFNDEADLNARFGHLIEAFKYGAPPHGGIAYGLDRIVMLMAKTDDIRDVIAFPKLQNASDIMMAAPDVVDEKQLAELHIALRRE